MKKDMIIEEQRKSKFGQLRQSEIRLFSKSLIGTHLDYSYGKKGCIVWDGHTSFSAWHPVADFLM